MRYTPPSPLVRGFLTASLCLVCAHCGDPAAGTWTSTTIPTPPMGSQPQYTMYSVSLTYGDGLTVSVDLEATRTMGAITYAGCSQSLTGMGTYTEVDKTITSTFASANSTRMSCFYMADNQTSTTLDMPTMTLLSSLSSGTFLIANDTLTLTTSGGPLTYNKQQQ